MAAWRYSKRLKALEDENARLKRLLANATLDNAASKEIADENCRPPTRSGGRSILSARS